MITYSHLVALSLIALLIFVGMGALRHRRGNAPYRRSRVYRIWPRRKEFRIIGITSLDEVEKLIDHFSKVYNVQMTNHDPEPDEFVWHLQNKDGAIEIHYDDHEGARLRTAPGRNNHRLFDWIARDIPEKRSFFF